MLNQCLPTQYWEGGEKLVPLSILSFCLLFGVLFYSSGRINVGVSNPEPRTILNLSRNLGLIWMRIFKKMCYFSLGTHPNECWMNHVTALRPTTEETRGPLSGTEWSPPHGAPQPQIAISSISHFAIPRRSWAAMQQHWQWRFMVV